MSGTIARSLGAMGDAMVGTANVNFDAGTLFVDSINNRVGIGTSSPGAELEVRDMAGDDDVRINLRPNVSTLSQVGASTTQTFIDSNGNRPFIFYINGAERARVTGAGDLQFNSGYGSVATAYGCRAWVNFNGTGTVAIRSSGNVSSIGDLGIGQYQVNFAIAMPDANYVIAGACGTNSSRVFSQFGTPTASQVPVNTTLSHTTAGEDQTHVYVAVFR